MNDHDDLNPQKVQQLLADAWSRLDPADRAERISYDIQHDIPGTTMHARNEAVEFVRGGRTLAMVPRELLTGDDPLDLSGAQFVPEELPNTVAELLDERDSDEKGE